MKSAVTCLLLILGVFFARGVLAACSDPASVAAARAAADAQCDCATAANHAQYLKCVAGVANARVADHSLPGACKRTVRQCASKSSCGRPGFVTCCIAKNGGSKCKMLRDATTCASKGGSVGTCASCCDACGGGSCATTTTTVVPGAVPTSTTTTLPSQSQTHTVNVAPGNTLTFAPANLVIHAGDKVHWVFAGGGHNVVSGTNGTADGKFCSTNDTNCRSASLASAGTTYEHVFTTTGKFPYFCSPHFGVGMTGTITVQ